MNLSTGTIASLVLTIGALMLLVATDSAGRRTPKTSYLRSGRKLYNYSRNNNNSYNGYSGGYAGNYGGNYDDANGGDNYVWACDDCDYGNTDDGSYYNANKNYQADGSSYNGRDQQWGGQSVQAYDDDEEPEVEVVEYDEDTRWEILGKFGGLSGAETLMVAGLAVVLSASLLCLFMLANGFNVIALCQLYCCCGVFRHKDAKAGDAVDDGFVNLGDY